MSGQIEIPCIQGYTVRKNLILTAGDTDTPATGFTGDEALTVLLWVGENQPAITTPAAATAVWVDYTTPEVQLEFDETLTATLDPGRYTVALAVNGGGANRVAVLVILDAPGSADAPTAYNVRKDIVNLVPWIEHLQSPGDLTGFADQSGQARDWVDQRILAACPFDIGWVRDQLAANKLLLTGPDGRRLVRAAALYAAGLILEREPGKQGETAYRDLGKEMKEDADALLMAGVVWIDTDGDGVGDYGIHPGVRHFLRA